MWAGALEYSEGMLSEWVGGYSGIRSQAIRISYDSSLRPHIEFPHTGGSGL
jgi:hypothetical protein